jgi:hypothetical protein
VSFVSSKDKRHTHTYYYFITEYVRPECMRYKT